MVSINLAKSFQLIYPTLANPIIGEFRLKFKSIFVLLNILMLFFLAVLVLLPHVMLGSSFIPTFWRLNWPIFLLWAVFFVAFNTFYFINRRLFFLLEREDWPALSRYLEERVIQKGNYSPRLVRLLANTYLVLSDSTAVMNLENKVAIAKPALLDTNALVFGTARILGKDISGAVRFFKTRRDKSKGVQKEWVYWYYGFSLLLDSRFEEAGREFFLLAQESTDAVITGLSSYFLIEIIVPYQNEKVEELSEISYNGRKRVRKAMPKLTDWYKEVSRLSSEIHAAAISKYMEEAGRWLYPE